MKSPICNIPKTASNTVKTQKETKKNARSSSTVDRKGTKNIVVKKEVDEEENVAAAMVVVEEAAEVAEMEEWKAAWAGFWSEVDEQTAWASCWCPFWEMESGDEDAYNALYDDVLWDYDIWDLKSIDNVNANSWKS